MQFTKTLNRQSEKKSLLPELPDEDPSEIENTAEVDETHSKSELETPTVEQYDFAVQRAKESEADLLSVEDSALGELQGATDDCTGLQLTETTCQMAEVAFSVDDYSVSQFDTFLLDPQNIDMHIPSLLPIPVNDHFLTSFEIDDWPTIGNEKSEWLAGKVKTLEDTPDRVHVNALQARRICLNFPKYPLDSYPVNIGNDDSHLMTVSGPPLSQR